MQVARYLRTAGLGTLLFDLLMPEEAVDRANVFDIELLAVRLLAATRWLRSQPATAELPIGYFGASTGAAAALWAAAEDPLVARSSHVADDRISRARGSVRSSRRRC